ncbi:DUF2683 domain-containing protein [Candidatus Woesearchaeota archaeon]|nr:DUF2683 domain-containing protein [Candidatus Woesearchaeota archaeon]
MVKAIINIDDHTNRILNIVKAKFGLNDKSEAIEAMAMQYESEILEPQLRPEFIEKMKKLGKDKSVKVGNLKEFRKRYGIK